MKNKEIYLVPTISETLEDIDSWWDIGIDETEKRKKRKKRRRKRLPKKEKKPLKRRRLPKKRRKKRQKSASKNAVKKRKSGMSRNSDISFLSKRLIPPATLQKCTFTKSLLLNFSPK